MAVAMIPLYSAAPIKSFYLTRVPFRSIPADETHIRFHITPTYMKNLRFLKISDTVNLGL